MYSGNRLHLPAVAQPQPTPINRLHLTNIGRAICRQRYFHIARNAARHARNPQHLITKTIVGELVNVTKKVQRFPGCRECRGYEFE